MTKKIFLAKQCVMGILALLACCPFGFAGTSSTGGGTFRDIEQEKLKSWLSGESVRNAIEYSLRTTDVNLIEDTALRTRFAQLAHDANFFEDIRSSKYSLQKSCRDGNGRKVLAATRIGSFKAPICFALNDIHRELVQKKSSPDEKMRRLALLAFHEHIHHFQKNSRDLALLEKEAFKLSNLIDARLASLERLENLFSNAQNIRTANSGVVFIREQSSQTGLESFRDTRTQSVWIAAGVHSGAPYDYALKVCQSLSQNSDLPTQQDFDGLKKSLSSAHGYSPFQAFTLTRYAIEAPEALLPNLDFANFWVKSKYDYSEYLATQYALGIGTIFIGGKGQVDFVPGSSKMTLGKPILFYCISKEEKN